MPEIDSLESMQARHEAKARYRLYFFDFTAPKAQQLTELERGLRLADARQKVRALNDALKAQNKLRFGDPRYGMEITNSWECMSEIAQKRHLALGRGRGPSYFNR